MRLSESTRPPSDAERAAEQSAERLRGRRSRSMRSSRRRRAGHGRASGIGGVEAHAAEAEVVIVDANHEADIVGRVDTGQAGDGHLVAGSTKPCAGTVSCTLVPWFTAAVMAAGAAWRGASMMPPAVKAALPREPTRSK